jgi:hypothetical protein
MPLAGLLALASLAGALVWASSAGAVVLSGVPCKGNASISGSVLVSAPVLGEVCNTAKPRFHHGHPRSAWVGSDFVGTSRSSLASQGCARTRPMSKSASQTSLSVAVAVRGNSASKGGRIAPPWILGFGQFQSEHIIFENRSYPQPLSQPLSASVSLSSALV